MEEKPEEENIPMRDLGDQQQYDDDWDEQGQQDYDPYQREEKYQETSFIDELLDRIDDKGLRDRARETIGQIDSEGNIYGEEEKIKRGIKIAIEKNSLFDELDTDDWDGFIIREERKKFDWEQRVKNLNQALATKDIYIDRENASVYNFIDQYIRDSLTPKKKDINGYLYKGKEIIKRVGRKASEQTFVPIEGPNLDEFIQDVRNIQESRASSILKDYANYDKDTEQIALEYMDELRKEQNKLIDESKDLKELSRNLKEISTIKDEIIAVRKNRGFKIRAKVAAKTLGGQLAKLFRWIRMHKKKIGGLTLTFLTAAGGALMSSLSLKNALKKGIKSVKQIGNIVKDTIASYIPLAKTSLGVVGTISGFSLTFLTAIFGGFLYYGVAGIILGLVSLGIASEFNVTALTSISNTWYYTSAKLRETSYTSVGMYPPKEVAETCMAYENVPDKVYYDSIEKKKSKRPKFYK